MIEGSALFLIASVLISGGLLAVVGDILGSKIGKARLRLGNLRPRQTAQVVTVFTGILIAATTLGINFALSKPLRQGVFELQEILRQLRIATADLEKVAAEKASIEEDLNVTKAKQRSVQRRLSKTNDNFEQAQEQLSTISKQAEQLRSDIEDLVADRKELLQQRTDLDEEIEQLRQQIDNRDQELKKRQGKIVEQDTILQQRQARLQELESQRQILQSQIEEQDAEISRFDQKIAAKDRELKRRENQLKGLEGQLTFLQQQVKVLEEYYQTYQELRERRIAILKGQVLAFAALRVVDPESTRAAIDRLLAQANRMVIEATQPGENPPNERVLRITQSQVEQLVNQLQDGREYVVRILSAGNYVQGEKDVRVFADLALNQQVFREGETIATISLDSSDRSERDIQERLDLLLSATQFRARRAGILGAIQVEEGKTKTLFDFVEKLSSAEEGFDQIKAVAAGESYTSGPLKIRLVVVDDGEVVFST